MSDEDKNIPDNDSPENENSDPYKTPESPEDTYQPEPYKKGDMPFLDHIEELRWRLIKSIFSIFFFGIIAFIFADYIFKAITIPLGDTKLHFTEVTGSFYAYLKISFFAGIIAALPILFYQMWKFIGPGLYDSEKKMVLPMVFFSTVLFLIGGSFCYFIVLPFAVRFLISYGGELMEPIITINSYIVFAGMLILAFGAAFQLPIIGYFLGRLGVVSSKMLGKGRPYALVGILVVAALITPPDVLSQGLLAGPLYILYEITIMIVKYTGKKEG